PMLALEGGRALLDPRWPHQLARGSGELADWKFVDAMRHRCRGHIHVEAQIIGGERAHEFAGIFDVEQRILAPGGAEHDVGRAFPHGVEETIGREIADAGVADGRDPADRSGYAQRLEGIVPQSMLVVARLVKHGDGSPAGWLSRSSG